MLGWADADLVRRMQKGWRGGLADGTPCGGGSTIASTAAICAALPALVARYGIASICDAGAGDQHWIGRVDWPVNYRGFDLVPRKTGVTQIDICETALPACDAVLCRHVLIHLDPERIRKALTLFRKSATFLLASQYDNAPAFDAGNQFNPTDLRPLLGEPIERIADTGSDLALWQL